MMTRTGAACPRKLLLAVGTVLLLLLLPAWSNLAFAAEANGGNVTDGASFVSALGENATCSYEGDTCVVALAEDVELTQAVEIISGSYRIEGSGTISRAAGRDIELIGVRAGASLEIAGDVVLDGGAVWSGGAADGSAVGAQNGGFHTNNLALVACFSGSVAISGNAELRNNDGCCAVYCDHALLVISGGSIHGISSGYGGGAVTARYGRVEVTGGDLWGNVANGASEPPRASGIFADAGEVAVSGGRLRDSSGPAAVTAARADVSGGEFSGNAGAALGCYYSTSRASISGGTFSGNAGGLYAPVGTGTSVPLRLSGSPSFGSDAVHAEVLLEGPLGDGVEVPIIPNDYNAGTVVAQGTNSYTISESELRQFKLTDDAPEGTYLAFDAANSRIVVSNATPVLVEVQVSQKPIVYDGEPIAPGEDFAVAVYEYRDGVRGDDVTADYAAGLLSYEYRAAGSSEGYEPGLPSGAGAYEVRVSAAADAAHGRAGASAEFGVTILSAASDPGQQGGEPDPGATKAANPLAANARKAVRVRASALRAGAARVARARAVAVSGARGRVAYRLESVRRAKFKRYFRVAAKTGRITVRRGLKRGTYRLGIAVTAAGDDGFEAATKVVTVKVKVK